jgi:GNAT superfamily N-acetyltransferase
MRCSERLDGSRTDVKWEHRMTLRIRPATVEDVPALAALLDAYMQEVFNSRWHGSRDALIADGFGAKFATILAESSDGQVVAFVAWQHSYDLHHCVVGAEVIDMYVAPAFRGRAVSLLLIAQLASQVRAFGGLFVKGQAVTRRRTQGLYERVAVSFPGADCIVGGRAFRALADLAGRPARFIVKNLPNKSWNHEA